MAVAGGEGAGNEGWDFVAVRRGNGSPCREGASGDEGIMPQGKGFFPSRDGTRWCWGDEVSLAGRVSGLGE